MTTPSAPPPLLEVSDLSVRFATAAGRVAAVRNVSFTLGAGEVLGIVGESGSGKTSLAKAILGLGPRSSGTVMLEGQPLFSSQASMLAQRKAIQPVFQDAGGALDPLWSVQQSLEEPLRLHGLASSPDRVAALLHLVQLDPTLLTRRPHQLSAGQRQRVNIARALAVEPRLLVLDEPVSSLDVSVQAQVLNLLTRLKVERHLTLLFISHALDVVAHVADRIGVMHQGQLVELASTDQLLREPAHAVTRQLLAAGLQ